MTVRALPRETSESLDQHASAGWRDACLLMRHSTRPHRTARLMMTKRDAMEGPAAPVARPRRP